MRWDTQNPISNSILAMISGYRTSIPHKTGEINILMISFSPDLDNPLLFGSVERSDQQYKRQYCGGLGERFRQNFWPINLLFGGGRIAIALIFGYFITYFYYRTFFLFCALGHRGKKTIICCSNYNTKSALQVSLRSSAHSAWQNPSHIR